MTYILLRVLDSCPRASATAVGVYAVVDEVDVVPMPGHEAENAVVASCTSSHELRYSSSFDRVSADHDVRVVPAPRAERRSLNSAKDVSKVKFKSSKCFFIVTMHFRSRLSREEGLPRPPIDSMICGFLGWAHHKVEVLIRVSLPRKLQNVSRPSIIWSRHDNEIM
jgi:hypothetical protein